MYWQISEKVKPHPMVVSILTRAEYVIPRWKIVPTKDVIDAAFKDPLKREEVLIRLMIDFHYYRLTFHIQRG